MNVPLPLLYNRVMTGRPSLPYDELVFLESLDEESRYARFKALWENGWSLASIGLSLTPPRPKTTIHFWISRAPEQTQFRPLPVPPEITPAKNSPAPTRLRTISPMVPADLKPKLQQLAALAQRYRARCAPDSPQALANEELTTIARTLRSMGVPTVDIAEAAGVSYRAMAKRLSK